jgi:hypothetical protein
MNQMFEGIFAIGIETIPSYRTNDPVLTKTSNVAKRGDTVYKVVSELLDSTNSGFKSIRNTIVEQTPNFYQPFKVIIHQGEDLSSSVNFQFQNGDLESVRYLRSYSNNINRVHAISERYGFPFPDPLGDGQPLYPTAYPPGYPLYMYDMTLRSASVDAGDLSYLYTPGTALNATQAGNIKNVLKAKATAELGKKQGTLFMDAKIAQNSVYKYGVDYNIGDLVYISGNYGLESKMRVIEHARILDNTGETSVPTLSPFGYV